MLGAVIWLVIAIALLPNPLDLMWGKLLLLLGAFVIVPLGMARIEGEFVFLASFFQLPAAALLAFSFTLPQGPNAFALAVPWCMLLCLLAFEGLFLLLDHFGNVSEMLVASAFLMIPIGGAWALADRLGYRPLSFDPVIVLLTAIHFHYAGFALPLLAGEALRERPSRLGTIGGWLVLAGVPLVAIGITTTQLGFTGWIESISAIALATGGLLISIVQWKSSSRWNGLAKALLRISAACLFVSMILAIWYALRLIAPIIVPDIPGMRATHGTLNALGFAVCGMVARSMKNTVTEL
jgi:YndJ-like protein